MKTNILIIISSLLSLQIHSQIFIDDGSGGGLYITDASGGTLTSPETISGNIALYVDSSIVIEGTYENNSTEVQLTGSLYNTGTFTSTGDEVFTGANTQTISGSFTGSNDFYNLIINKDAGTMVQLGTNVETDSQGIINLNQGLIRTTPSYYVYTKNTNTAAIMNAGANGSLDQFIEGELRRNIVQGSTYDFPVGGTHTDSGGGDGVQYVSIQSNNGDGIISAIFHDSTGIGVLDSIVICPTGTGDFQDAEYRIRNGSWEVTNPGGGINNYNITLSPIDFTNNSYVDYTILKDGVPTGRDLCDGIPNTLPIMHDSLTSFSLFEIAASTNTTLLPIELLSFEASVINPQEVQLDWQTASERNNDYFTIERSTDGLNWEEVTKVKGAGVSSKLLSYTSFDENPFQGISYYRLKQTDFDGKFSYSEIRDVKINGLQVKIYPNPASNHIIIEGDESELEYIVIYNILGENVTYLTQKDTNSGSKLIINLSDLSPGAYNVKTKTTTNKVYKQ